jgi:DNA invertase Pin-like site-specific DNA recombinase
MVRRAVIYIRTSSEMQGEKSSPAEQETDCRRLAQDNGLTVVRVYRDVEKYRVGNKLVAPSGSRPDRPGLLAMLKDATRDEFDIILAWREDRLYCGLRSMLMVLETVQEYKIEILLAKETFDPKITPVRTWAAQMELDGMKERMGMGVKARHDDEQMKRDELQLEEEIKKLNAERQEFIPKARKGHISEEESTPQISVMYDKELGVKRRLTAIEQEEDAFEKLDLEEQVRKDVAELQSEMAELMTANPKTLDECHRVFLLKKRIVDTVLMEASIDERREIHIKFCTDFSTHSGQTQERVDIFDARRKL